MENISGVLSYLKFRVGWGVAGNQDFGNYLWLETYQQGAFDAAYQLGNEFYLTVRPVGVDPNIRRKQLPQILALIMSYLLEKFSDLLNIITRLFPDLLFNSVFPAGSLTRDRAVTNIGEMNNKGFELEIGSNIIETDDWNISVNMNAAYNQNEMVNLDAQSIQKEMSHPSLMLGEYLAT